MCKPGRPGKVKSTTELSCMESQKDSLSKQTNLSKKRIRKRAEDEDIKSSNNITSPLLWRLVQLL